jgi:hypothetical protein
VLNPTYAADGRAVTSDKKGKERAMAGETGGETPNFFEILGLDPDDHFTDEKFQQVLQQKYKEWKGDEKKIGSKKAVALRYLALYNEKKIQQTMQDPTRRRQQAEAYREIRRARRQERRAEFEQVIDIIRRGEVEEAQIQQVIKDCAGVFSEAEIRARLKVSSHKKSAEKSNEGPLLDPSSFTALQKDLLSLSPPQKDLYDFFEKHERTSRKELLEEADTAYEWIQHFTHKTAEITQKKSIIERAQRLFATDEEHAKYQRSLRQARLDALLKQFEQALQMRSEKHLTSAQVTQFLEQAGKDGWSLAEAWARLQMRAAEADPRWILDPPAISVDSSQQRCGTCGAYSPQDATYCNDCKSALHLPCPDCGKQVAADDAACACGFAIGNRFEVDKLMTLCREQLAQQYLVQASASLHTAGRMWQPRKPDARQRALQELQARLRELEQARKKQTQHLDDLLNRRRFSSARVLLARQGALFGDTERESYTRLIEDALARAQALLHQARMQQAQEQKIALCVQAVRLCADLQEARDLLATLPPTPPQQLQGQVHGSLVSLRWAPSTTQNVSYCVIRKNGSQPLSPDDGERLAGVSGCIFEDTQPETGVSLFYAVFAMLEEVFSREAARLQRPLVLPGEVRDVRVRAESQCVTLCWQTPPHLANLWITRKEGRAPVSPADGVHLQSLDLQGVVDHDVENGHLYVYTIYCQFQDYSGQLVTSHGVTIQARPEAAPESICALTITNQKVESGYEVTVRWAAPSTGEVAIIKSHEPLPFQAGEVLARSQLSRYGSSLPVRQPDTCQDRWERTGIAYYTPVVLFQENAYLGQSQRYALIEDVRDLRCENRPTGLRLSWVWPPLCKEVRVAYASEGWPRLEHSEQVLRVARSTYDQKGYFEIQGASGNECYLIVAAFIEHNGTGILGSGISKKILLGDPLTLTYEIRQPRNLFGAKKRSVHITVRGTGFLPALVLRYRQGRVPLGKKDSEPYMQMSGRSVTDGEVLELQLPEKQVPPGAFGKLLLADDALYGVVTIHHPGEEKVRLA